jgi:hypothetical protein
MHCLGRLDRERVLEKISFPLEESAIVLHHNDQIRRMSKVGGMKALHVCLTMSNHKRRGLGSELP